MVSDRGRGVWTTASSRQCGGGSRSLRGCEGTPSCSSWPTQMSATRARLEARQCREHQLADRVEAIAALLDRDGGQPERAQRAPGRPEAGGRDVERALRIAARGVDAQSDHERRGPALARPGGELVDAVEPRLVAGAGRE